MVCECIELEFVIGVVEVVDVVGDVIEWWW